MLPSQELLLAAIAGRPHRHLGARGGLVELSLDMRDFNGFTAPGQTFVETVEAPDIVRVLAGPA
mgnify:FL=1